MVFSNVESAASSSSPVGCVLRDHNRRGHCRDNSTITSVSDLQKNLTLLVSESLNNHDVSVLSDFSSDENTRKEQLNGFGSFRFGEISNTQKEKLDENCCLRKNQHLDQWASKQAQEMVSVIKKPTPETHPSNASNLGASSLVRIWEKRLCKPSNVNREFAKANLYISPDTAFFTDETFSISGFDVSEKEVCNCQASISEPFSNKLAEKAYRSSCPKSPKDRSVNFGDIVKKLASCDNEKCSGDLPKKENGEKIFLPQVLSSPRIRGRQALNDLLMQMEQDRYRELFLLRKHHAVSKFPHKGRIQSLLRLKLLQGHMIAQQQMRPPRPTKHDIIWPPKPKGSDVVQLRERSVMGGEQVTAACSDNNNSKSPPRVRASHTCQTEECPSACQLYDKKKTIQTSEQQSTFLEQHSMPCVSKDIQEETSSSSDAREEALSSTELSTLHSIENTQGETSSGSEQLSVSHPGLGTIGEELKLEACNDESQESRDRSDLPWPGPSWDSGNMYYESAADEAMFSFNWDENQVAEEHDYELMDSSHDWINDIARPKSYWEDCRQERYQEVLNANSSNGEICRLLERRTVSNFLNSGLRDVIDQIIGSRAKVTRLSGVQDKEDIQGRLDKQLTHPLKRFTCMNEKREVMELGGDQTDPKKQHLLTNKGDNGEEVAHQIKNKYHKSIEDVEMDKVNDMICMRSHETTEVKGDEDEEDEGEEEEADRAETEYLDQYNEDSDYSDNYLSTSWSAQDLLGSNYQAASTTSDYQERRYTISSPNHASDDKAIVSGLRGQMEQLRQEMSELKDTVKLCMEMQRQMQQTLMRVVCMVPNDEKSMTNKRSGKGSCFMCCEMQVDSLLYRCGHMCTCLKCAHELQSNSGKCPICQAPIDDVVRVQLHT